MAADVVGVDGQRPPSPLRRPRLALRVFEEFVLGDRPQRPRAATRSARAARCSTQQLEVTESGVVWRTRRGGGVVDAQDIARVVIIETVYRGPTVMGAVVLYALVVDHDDAVRLRVAATGMAGPGGVRSKHALREVWAPLGVPVVRETRGGARPKDYRRQWPEAFGFVHARPYATLGLIAAAWMLLAVPLLNRFLGS